MLRKRWTIPLCLLIGACARPNDAGSPIAPPALPPPEPVLIHLPGIGGELPIDHRLVNGLVQAGVAPRGQILDWTGQYRGLLALGKLDHNRAQADRLADRIIDVYRADPRTRIILTAHSGGTGIAVWALEELPDDVRIDTLVMLASALSADYDLSRALAHTRRAFSLHSERDNLVLGDCTRTLGTIDRVFADAAGYVGFRAPAASDPAQYAKLHQIPYDPAWIKQGNPGDHIGAMDDQFAREIIAPMIQSP